MTNELLHLVKKHRANDKESTLKLIKRFEPLINKYKSLLNYEDAKNDLIVIFITVLNKAPTSNEGAMLKYISLSMKNAYIKLSIKNKKIKKVIFFDDYSHLNILNDDCFISKYEIKRAIEKLSNVQKKIIQCIFFYGYSVNETARMLHVTRQTICNHKRKALKKLKSELM